MRQNLCLLSPLDPQALVLALPLPPEVTWHFTPHRPTRAGSKIARWCKVRPWSGEARSFARWKLKIMKYTTGRQLRKKEFQLHSLHSCPNSELAWLGHQLDQILSWTFKFCTLLCEVKPRCEDTLKLGVLCKGLSSCCPSWSWLFDLFDRSIAGGAVCKLAKHI